MPESATLPVLCGLIAKHFRVAPGSIAESTTALDVDGWDSMTHTLLLIQIEQAFAVRLDEMEGFRAASVGDLAKIIEVAVARNKR
jgi:acyl carrier protein